MRYFVIVLTVICSLQVSSAYAFERNSGTLLKNCNQDDPSYGRVFCLGILAGSFSNLLFYHSGIRACVTEDKWRGVNNIQLLAIFQKWAKENPEKWNLPAVIGVQASIAAAYNCE